MPDSINICHVCVCVCVRAQAHISLLSWSVFLYLVWRLRSKANICIFEIRVETPMLLSSKPHNSAASDNFVSFLNERGPLNLWQVMHSIGSSFSVFYSSNFKQHNKQTCLPTLASGPETTTSQKSKLQNCHPFLCNRDEDQWETHWETQWETQQNSKSMKNCCSATDNQHDPLQYR